MASCAMPVTPVHASRSYARLVHDRGEELKRRKRGENPAKINAKSRRNIKHVRLKHRDFYETIVQSTFQLNVSEM